jgi:hypothetical protein
LACTLHAQNYFTPQFNQFIGQANPNAMAMPALLIAPDARAAGMGEGGIATANDANAMHWNLSNLAFVKHRFGFSMSYTPWMRALVPNVNHVYAAGYFKPDSVSVVAASVRYFSMGTITLTSAGGSVIGEFKPNEVAVDAGYSRRFGEHFSAGMTFRGIRSNLSNGITINGQTTRAGTAYAVDLSGTYRTREFQMKKWTGQLTTGVVLTNLGTKMSYNDINKFYLPLKAGLGQGLRLQRSVHAIAAQTEISQLLLPPTSSGKPALAWSAGAEYDYAGILRGRAGYYLESEAAGGRNYITLGAGVAYNVIALDFAYLIATDTRSPLQNTMRFSLLFNFARTKITPRK